MKLMLSLIGALISGLICFVFFSLISKYQIEQEGYTPSQSDQLIDAFLIVTPLLIIAGGVLSYSIYTKYQKHRIRKNSKQHSSAN